MILFFEKKTDNLSDIQKKIDWRREWRTEKYLHKKSLIEFSCCKKLRVNINNIPDVREKDKQHTDYSDRAYDWTVQIKEGGAKNDSRFLNLNLRGMGDCH